MDPTLPRPVTPAEARRVARSVLMGAPYVVLALGIAAAAWWTLEHALPYVSALALTALIAAVCFARGEA
jgi:membrane protein YdbS with pleckstrin-like domain